MLKKLIILLIAFAMGNSINCAAAQNVIDINYIAKATPEDLVQMQPDDRCPICQEVFSDTNDLYKSSCPQILTHPHIFHRHCILGFINSGLPNALNCPLCRGEMVDLNFLNITLIEASRNGRLEEVRLLLNRGADVNARTDFGQTALMLASYNEHLEIAQLLLDRGADVNARSNSGRTALIIARQNRHQEIADLLIAHGAIK